MYKPPYPEEKNFDKQWNMLNPDEIDAAKKTMKIIDEEFSEAHPKGRREKLSPLRLNPFAEIDSMSDLL